MSENQHREHAVNNSRRRKAAAGMLLLLALGLIVFGYCQKHKVYEPDSGEFGILIFDRISDVQLTIDATFTGVVRKGKRLYSTYDRSEPRGKRKCPT